MRKKVLEKSVAVISAMTMLFSGAIADSMKTVIAAEADRVQQVSQIADTANQQVSQIADNAKIPGQGNVLYQNNFANGNGLSYYEGLSASTPVYSGNTLTIPGGNSNKVVVDGKTYTDFVVEADVKVSQNSSNSSNQGGIIFRVTNPYGGVSDGYNGYYFGIDAGNKEAILGKVHDNTWTMIARKKMTVDYNKYYHLSVAVSGNEIKGYVNYNGSNYAKIIATDSDFSSGTVGFRHWQAGATFKSLSVSEYSPSTPADTYTNSVLASCADPDVLYYGGVYYMYATNTTGANNGFKVYASTDLVNWVDKGWALVKDDVYGTSGFWAPDLIEKDGIFYMYYVANEHLSVATSTSPLGPFKQTEAQQVPMHETKEIDAHVFKDDDGQYYIYFVRFNNGNHIYGAKLNSDMRTMDESTIKCLISPQASWETNKANVCEGPFMLKKDGVYYLTYSGSHFESEMYGSGYATSNSPLGTYSKYANNPIMQSNTLVHGAGHHGIAMSPDGKEMFIVYHCHSSLTKTEPRRLCIDRMHFIKDDNGNTVLEVEGPTITPQAMPSGYNDEDVVPDSVKLPGQGNILYQKYFANSTGLSYYAGTSASTPIYIKNTFTIPGGNSNKLVVDGKNYTDFVVESDVRVYKNGGKTSNQGGIIFRVTNPYSGVSDGYNGYYFGIDAGNNEAILGKVHENTWTMIARSKMTIDYDKYYHLTVAVSGNEIKGYVNYDGTKEPDIVATDNDFSSGTVGYRHWQAGSSFKNLKVSEYVPDPSYGTSIEITGFQYSTKAEGLRTVYSVTDKNSKVEKVGLIYALKQDCNESDMIIGSSNKNVFAYDATGAGKLSTSYSDADYSTSYAMTMILGNVNTAFLSEPTYVRAFAKLTTGEYIYSNVEEYRVYSVADCLYKGCLMGTLSAHEYLYNKILLRVNPDYKAVDYIWNGELADM
jgi:beta-xylosidase